MHCAACPCFLARCMVAADRCLADSASTRPTVSTAWLWRWWVQSERAETSAGRQTRSATQAKYREKGHQTKRKRRRKLQGRSACKQKMDARYANGTRAKSKLLVLRRGCAAVGRQLGCGELLPACSWCVASCGSLHADSAACGRHRSSAAHSDQRVLSSQRLQ